MVVGSAVLKDKRRNEWTVRLGGGSVSQGELSPTHLRALKEMDGHEGVCKVMVTAMDHIGNCVEAPVSLRAA